MPSKIVALAVAATCFLGGGFCAEAEGRGKSKVSPMDVWKSEVSDLLNRFDENGDVTALGRALDLVESIDGELNARRLETPSVRLKTRLLLSVFNHIDAKRVVGFDFSRRPPFYPAPPPETCLPSGVDPQSIGDPILRARYEKDLAANQLKLRAYSFQARLRDADTAWSEALDSHVSEHYARSSATALGRMIDELVASPARAQRLKERLSAVLGNRP